jgi:predicted DNA-binding transcriptional regulator YafY
MPGELFEKQDRLARLLLLVNLLHRNPAGLTAPEIGARVGRTARTAYRDLQLLGGELHIPVWNDKGRWFLDSKAFLPPLNLTLHEAVSLFLSARLMAGFSDKRDEHILATFGKLASILPQPIARQVDATVAELSALPRNDTYQRVFDVLARCWAESTRARIWYPHTLPTGHTKVYERLVSPYFLEPYPSGHSCYLIAHDDRAQAQRVFKVERIQRAEATDETFEVPADYDAAKHLQQAWGVANQEPAEVRLLFIEPDAVKRVCESRWHPSQTERPRADGTLEVGFRVGGLLEITPWILGWGSAVEVLAPAELRDRVAATALALTDIYGRAPVAATA